MMQQALVIMQQLSDSALIGTLVVRKKPTIRTEIIKCYTFRSICVRFVYCVRCDFYALLKNIIEMGEFQIASLSAHFFQAQVLSTIRKNL